jgi:uncharacterized membrane protein YeaQ/YmgE (transglycosylase-associated protein family)
METDMSLINWIILGFIAGIIASKIVNKTGERFTLDILLVIVGTVTSSWLFGLFGMHSIMSLNIYSLIAALCGAVAFLVFYHTVSRRVYLLFASKKS